MKNKKTIIYTINMPGFKYHIVKGEMKKGSIISKSIHPIEQVNIFRDKLLSEGKLLEYQNQYMLKETIRVGALLAYNLFSGKLEKKFESLNDIVIRKNDKIFMDEFGIENVYPSDSIIKSNEYMDSMMLVSINKLDVKFEKFSNHNGDAFSDIEKLFYDVLIDEGIINNTARHGISNNRECDIVDEEKNIQIEIITEFKNRIKNDKTPHRNLEAFTIEMVDNNLIHSSQALIDKFCKKNYTSKYEKQIGIFCIGSKNSVKRMLTVLEENLKKSNIKNNFTKLYIIWYDLFDDNYYFYFDKKIKKLDNINLKIVNKKKIDLSAVRNDEKYLFILKNIFKDEFIMLYLKKQEAMEYLKKLRVVI